MPAHEFAVVLQNLIIVSTILIRDEETVQQYIAMLQQISDADPLLAKMAWGMAQVNGLSSE